MMVNNSYKSVLIIILFISFFGVLCFVVLSGDHENIKKDEKNINIFYVSHFNRKSNTTTIGFAKAPSSIFKNGVEFITFRSKNEEIFSVVSSKLSNTEFECYGTCLCNDPARRTVNINILSKSLYFIVSAFSLSLAVKIATNYFSEECHTSLKNICFAENIETEINFCESKSHGTEKEYENDPVIAGKTVEEKTEMIEKAGEEDKFEGWERDYHCEGYCLPNGRLVREESIYQSDKFECEKYTQEIKLTIIETAKLGFIGAESSTGMNGNMKAKNKFVSEYLVPYCRSISDLKYEYVYTYPSGEKSIKKSRVNLCVGTSYLKPYENMCCTLLDPFSTRDGRRERERINKENG